MLRLILAVILGPLIGLVVLGAVDGAANTIFPPPAGVNLTDPAAIRAATAVLPFGAQVGAILAWLLGGAGRRLERQPDRRTPGPGRPHRQRPVPGLRRLDDGHDRLSAVDAGGPCDRSADCGLGGGPRLRQG